MKNQQETEEQKINKYLLQGLKTYQSLKKQGKEKEAILILRITSEIADLALEVLGIREGYNKVTCRCGRQLKTADEIQFFNQIGTCLGCDHVWGEYMEQKEREYEGTQKED